MASPAPPCVQCNLPVVVNRDMYDVFERMHWVCFHFAYEHEGDPDEACRDPSCPMRVHAADQLLQEIRDGKHSLPGTLVQIDRYFGEASSEP